MVDWRMEQYVEEFRVSVLNSTGFDPLDAEARRRGLCLLFSEYYS